jgi:peroxiredoxin Q/BCP
MKALSKDIEKFKALNAEIYPILVDSRAHAKGMFKAHAKRVFPIYYDSSDRKISKRILRQQWKFFRLGRMPALLVIDTQQIIRYAHYGDSMSDIPSNKEILAILEELNKE